MACRYTYQGKTYEAHEFDDVLRAMAPDIAAKYMPGVEFVASAPFVGKTDAYTSLLLKRLLNYAAEGGYDAIAWTRGDQQVERYRDALRKQVDVIEWKKTPEGVQIVGYKGNADTRGWSVRNRRIATRREFSRPNTQIVDIYNPTGNVVETNFPVDGKSDEQIIRSIKYTKVVDTTEKESALSDSIGKAMADRIRNDSNQTGTIEGEGITVSSTGMSEYYDRIVPKVANEISKKLGGGKVTEIDIGKPLEMGAPRVLGVDAPIISKQQALELSHAMREKIMEGLPLFSRRTSGIPEETQNRAEMIADAIIYDYQDKFVDLKNRQKETPPKSEEADAYLATERYPRLVKAVTDDFHDDELTPLVQAIHDAKLGYEEVQEYLYAKHAPSRNAVMTERNPTEDEIEAKRSGLSETRDALADKESVVAYINAKRELRNAEAEVEEGVADESTAKVIRGNLNSLRKIPEVREYIKAIDGLKALRNIKPFKGDNTALSGMTDQEAAGIVSKAKKDGKFDSLEKISGMVNKITSGTRVLMAENGLITEAESDSWDGMWKNYVPLHRDEVGDAMPKIGQGMSVRGKESKHATGSTKEATNILAHVMAQREAAIIRSEKVKVDRALANFISENPDGEMWELDVAPMVRDLDKTTGLVVSRVDPTYKNKPNVLTYKVNGEEHTITFNEKNLESMRLAASLKNMSATELGEVTVTIGKVTRFLATMNTSANPVFVARNFLRDIQTAFVNLSDTELHGMKKEVFSNIHNAVRGMWDMSRGNDQTEWSKHAREFRDSGGQVGYTDYYKDISARAEKLKSQLEDMGGGWKNITKREAAAWWNLIEDANLAVENGVRLAAFVAARNAGMSVAKSASLAGNLTVNFNRHGAKGVELNMWYMFMNASIQGTARLFQAMKNKQVQKIIGGVVASGFLLDILARAMAGDDDDDGENDYDQVPEYVKQKNFVFWAGRPVTIPMPYGYNFFSNVGRKMSQSMFQKDYSPARGAVELFSVAFDAFSPTGQSGSLVQLVSPTIFDPFVQWTENKNFTGNPIRKEQSPFGLPVPEYQMGFKSVSAPSKAAAEFLNTITGGNQVRAGWLDLNPALFDFAVTSAFGGAGRTYLQAFSLPIKLATEEDVQAREIPFTNIFMGSRPEHQLERGFYESLRAVETVAAERKLYAGDAEKMAEIKEDHASEIKMIGRAKMASAALKNIRHSEMRIEKSELQNKRDLLKKLEERKNRIMADFNKRYHQAAP